jgi:hypothetical protein
MRESLEYLCLKLSKRFGHVIRPFQHSQSGTAIE